MGNAAAVQSVSESARRRLLLHQHNARPDVLVSRAVQLAFQRRQLHGAASSHSPSSISTTPLPLSEIYDVLSREFGVCCSLQDLPRALEQLGCRAEGPTSATTTDRSTDDPVDQVWYSVAPLVAFIRPRRVLRQVRRPAQSTEDEREYVWSGLTVWQAAKGGDADVLSTVCERFPLAYRALDAFGNTPLYYASLCGREEAVSALMACYDRAKCVIPADELLRCVTNALNARTRGLLQRKLSLEEALAIRTKEQEDEQDDEGGGFFLGVAGDDDPY